jgi:predicted nucleotidyltransferase
MSIDNAVLADPKVTELVRRLVEAVQPDKIYLFGSRARGDATEESDYDVLLLVNQPTEQCHSLARKAYHSLWGIGMPVDVVVMSKGFFERRRQALSSLPATVEREGRLLYAA